MDHTGELEQIVDEMRRLDEEERRRLERQESRRLSRLLKAPRDLREPDDESAKRDE